MCLGETQGHGMLQGEEDGGVTDCSYSVHGISKSCPSPAHLEMQKHSKKTILCLKDITAQSLLTLKSPCGSCACCDYSSGGVDYSLKQTIHGRRDYSACYREIWGL